MKKTFALILLLALLQVVRAQSRDYAYQAVPFTSVKLNDAFSLPRVKINNDITIPASFERRDKTGRVKNFVMAAEKSGKGEMIVWLPESIGDIEIITH
jgi:hypothetical protein